jgi:hypothetical protein
MNSVHIVNAALGYRLLNEPGMISRLGRAVAPYLIKRLKCVTGLDFSVCSVLTDSQSSHACHLIRCDSWRIVFLLAGVFSISCFELVFE